MAIKLTKTNVEKIKQPEKGQVFYRDSELKGFALRVTKGAKTYIAETSVRGRSCRVTIGKHGVFTPEQARKEAKLLLADMARGINPNQQKAQERLRTTTLQQAFEEYLAVRSLKPTTQYNYQRCFVIAFTDWHTKPVVDVSKTMVAERYTELCLQHGDAYANLSMRLLHSLFNFIDATYEDQQGQSIVPINPVQVLAKKRQWKTVQRREEFIKPDQLAVWWAAVEALQSHTFRDYFRLLLLTGLRKQEAMQLSWDRVDFREQTLTINDTKNKQTHILPLSDFLVDLLQQRHANHQSASPWVFPNHADTRAINDVRPHIQHVITEAGFPFRCHDLRRTFATTAERLDIAAYTIKRLLNHKQGDVTAGYIIRDVNRLREPMQRITDALLQDVMNKET